MRKFERPEMTVVRFTEEDVIVASGSATPSIVVSGLMDGTPNNLGINYKGHSYGSSTLGDLAAAFAADGLNDRYHDFEFTGTCYDLTNDFLTMNDERDDYWTPNFNGTWVYDSGHACENGNGAFVKQ